MLGHSPARALDAPTRADGLQFLGQNPQRFHHSRCRYGVGASPPLLNSPTATPLFRILRIGEIAQAAFSLIQVVSVGNTS